MKITKYKNNSSAKELNNRLMRLEKILEQLIGAISGGKDNSLINGKMLDNIDSIPEKLITELLAGGRNRNENLNPSVFTSRPTQNQTKVKNNNMLLSHGQMIAELASAISRLGNRNS